MATKEQAMQTWWRVLYGEIKPFDVVKVTPKTVTYVTRFIDFGGRLREDERRALRDYEQWFDNERDAVEYQRSRLVGRVNATREAAMIAADKLAVFNEKYPVED